MNALKRIGLLVFGIAGLVALATLLMPWVGPWTKLGTSLMSTTWYLGLAEISSAITAVGLLVVLGRAIFTPRNAKTVVVSKANGDEVTVATAAISSQAAHIIEQDRDYVAEKVWVSARRRGHVRVTVRVRPAHAVDVTVEGKRLHDLLMEGLAKICGSAIDRVKIEFVEPDSLDPKPDYLSTTASETSTPSASSWEASWEPSYSIPETPGEITFAMPTAVSVDDSSQEV